MNKEIEELREKPINIICQPKGYGKTYYEIQKLIKENKELQQKVKQLEEDYKNEVEENLKLSELWRKSQEEKRQLETNRDDAIEILKLCNSQCSKETISKLERGKE